MIETTKPWSERMALSVMKRYTSEQVRWHYEHGLVLQSIYAVGKRYHNEHLCAWVKTMYGTKILSGGVIDGYKRDTFQLDSINAGKMLFELYKTSGDEKYRIALETLREQLDAQPRTHSGGFWHKKGYPDQMWLDGLYMAGPFLAQYAAVYGKPADFADVVKQLALAESHTRDANTGLLYHAWDESRTQPWANKETGASPHFWGRAMGWYCMALVDVLDFMNEETLIGLARSLVQPLLAVQDAESGLWYQVLEPKVDSAGARGKNYLESSASAMFVYFFLKMLRKGYADASTADALKTAALKAYDGLVRDKITVDADGELHLLDTCGGCGLGKVPGDGGPYRDGSFEYYVNERICVDDFKGIGPFILASLERETVTGERVKGYDYQNIKWIIEDINYCIDKGLGMFATLG